MIKMENVIGSLSMQCVTCSFNLSLTRRGPYPVIMILAETDLNIGFKIIKKWLLFIVISNQYIKSNKRKAKYSYCKIMYAFYD